MLRKKKEFQLILITSLKNQLRRVRFCISSKIIVKWKGNIYKIKETRREIKKIIRIIIIRIIKIRIILIRIKLILRRRTC